MYAADPSALVEKGQAVVMEAGVDLKKRYLGVRDVVYSSAMGRLPRVPRFKTEDED